MNKKPRKMNHQSQLIANRSPWMGWDDVFRMNWGFPRLRHHLPLEPSYHVRETPEIYELDMVLPGLNKEDISISVKDDILEISYEIERSSQSSEGSAKRKDYIRSSYRKQFHLSENMDRERIQARYEKGILELQIPKRNPAVAQTKQVPIQ